MAWHSCKVKDLALAMDYIKNGFSDPTKEQIGWDQCRKDVMNDHQEKALKEGCHER